MTILTKGSFRVRKFAFVDNNSQTIYSNTAQMWGNQIDWGSLKNKVLSQSRGNRADAEFMTKLLNDMADPNSEDNQKMTDEEKKWIYDLMGQRINGIGFKYKKQPGVAFERRMATLVSKLFDKVSRNEIWTGSQTTTSQGLILNIASQNQIRNSSELRKLLLEDINSQYRSDLEALTFELAEEIQKGDEWRSSWVVRDVARQGKIDINIPFNLSINTDLSEPMERLAQLLAGHTFSLKNYLELTIKNRGVSLGSTRFFRYLSSFYFYSTNNENFVDTCTFVYSTKNSKNQTTIRYKDWARFLYELTGIGQVATVDGSRRLVDYLVILQRDGDSHVLIKDVASLLEGMPDRDVSIGNFSFSQGHLMI